MYFRFGLSIRTFEVSVISVVTVFITYLVFSVLKDKKGQRH